MGRGADSDRSVAMAVLEVLSRFNRPVPGAQEKLFVLDAPTTGGALKGVGVKYAHVISRSFW